MVYLVASSKLGVVLQFILIQPRGHLHDVMDLKFDDFGQRGKHALWNDLQNLRETEKPNNSPPRHDKKVPEGNGNMRNTLPKSNT